MREVGLRELKNGLAACVREVRAGRELRITDRGKVVAKLVPPDWLPVQRRSEDSLYPDLPPLLRWRSAAELLQEERGGR